jgi:hypothetical protein
LLRGRGEREPDLDRQAAIGAGYRGERGVVGAGDGADDREAEPVPVAADAFLAESAERFEQPLDIVGPVFETETVASSPRVAVAISTRPRL